MYCKQCGQQMGEWQKFCIGCGAAAPVLNQPVFQVNAAPVLERPMVAAPVSPFRLISKTEKTSKWILFSIVGSVVGFFLFLFFMVQASTPEGQKREAERKEKERVLTPASAERSAEEAGATPHWIYVEEKDKIRGTINKTASVESINTVKFGFPYEGVQRATFGVVKYSDFVAGLILAIPKGQFVCNRCEIVIRLDDRNPKYFSATTPADGSTNELILSPLVGEGEYELPKPSDIVAELKKSKKMFVEATFYQEGDRVFEFDVSGLKF